MPLLIGAVSGVIDGGRVIQGAAAELAAIPASARALPRLGRSWRS